MDDKKVAQLLQGSDLVGIKELISKGGDILADLPVWRLPALIFMVYRFDGISDIEKRDEIISYIIEVETKVRQERNYWDDISFKRYLLFALEKGFSESIVYKLIKMGSDVNETFYGRKTPLCYAIKNNYSFELMSTLIVHGADMHLDFDGLWSVLNKLCNNCKNTDCKSKQVFYFLLKKGLDLNKTDYCQNTVIHLSHCKFIINYCIKRGVSVETKNRDGFTPLMSAVVDGLVDKVDMLLKFGADPKDCLTLSPAEDEFFDRFESRSLERRSFKDGIIDLLLYHGADLFNVSDKDETSLSVKCYGFCNFLSYHKILIRYYLLYIDQDNLHEYFQRLSTHDKKWFQSYCDLCKEELNKMKNTYIKNELTFYEFCKLKKFYSSDVTCISAGKFYHDCKSIKELFPVYCDLIIMKINDNVAKRRKTVLNNILENLIINPINLLEKDFEFYLNYDCLCYMSKDLSTLEIYNLFLASVIPNEVK